MIATYGFATSHRNVGEKLLSQLVISSRAQTLSAPIIVKHVDLVLRGSLRGIRIEGDTEQNHKTSRGDGLVQLYDVALKQNVLPFESSSPSTTTLAQSAQFLMGVSDLTFPAGVTKVFLLETMPREPGEMEVLSATMHIEEEHFEFEVVTTGVEHLRQHDFWIESNEGLTKENFISDNSLTVKILPRPPKIQIHVENLRKSYFTDELISFGIQITNSEAAAADVVLQGQLLGHSEALPTLEWISNENAQKESEQRIEDEMPLHNKMAKISLGLLNPEEIKQTSLSFQAGSETAEYVLKVDVIYHLLTDPETLILKNFETELVFEKPFDASYTLLPQVHPSSWPSYFSVDDIESSDPPLKDTNVGHGLKQNWHLTANIAHMITEAIDINHVSLQVLDSSNDTICRISELVHPSPDGSTITPDNIDRRQFELELQKYSLDDSRPVKLSFQLEIGWRRQRTQAALSTTHIAVPELVIPFGEPRVLASVHPPPQGQSKIFHVEYTIENPSMYVLTFNLSMETSDEFAFSGAKATSIQLVPLSRHTVRYNIFPLAGGKWITPLFRVVDSYFNQTLKVQATQGLQSDAEGLHIWVDAED